MQLIADLNITEPPPLMLEALDHASPKETVAVLKTKNIFPIARLVRLERPLCFFCAPQQQLDRRRPAMNQYLISQFVDSTKMARKRRLKLSLVRH